MAMVRSTDEQERYLRYLFLFPEHTFMVFAIIRILDLEPSLLVLVANSHLCSSSTFPFLDANQISENLRSKASFRHFTGKRFTSVLNCEILIIPDCRKLSNLM